MSVWLYFLHADIQCSDIISDTILMRKKKTVGISTVKWKPKHVFICICHVHVCIVISARHS